MPIVVEIENMSGNEDIPDETTMRSWISAALRHRQGDAELSVRIVSDEEMTALNRQFRNKPSSTNVLSFPAELPDFVGIPLLGDIVICAEVVAREAVQQHKQVRAHWAHMLVHGTLHLLGYDHINDDEAAIMENLETSILVDLGFSPPYEFNAEAAIPQETTHNG